ncbi:conserved hypothetical protein [Gammaproteobacteria bacterium]
MNKFEPELLESLKKAISTDAPVLVQLLDYPATTSMAVSLLAKALVSDSEAPLADVLSTARSTSNDIKLRIAAAEQQGQLRLRQSAVEESISLVNLTSTLSKALIEEQTEQDKVILGDIADARKRQTDLHDDTNRVLSYIVTVAFFAMIVLLMNYNSERTNINGVRDLLFTLFGVIATGWSNIIGYYFGSSIGSSQKSKTLESILKNKKYD